MNDRWGGLQREFRDLMDRTSPHQPWANLQGVVWEAADGRNGLYTPMRTDGISRSSKAYAPMPEGFCPLEREKAH
jgi:hypothetical protein